MSNYIQIFYSFLVLTSGKLLKALGSRIGTGLVFCLSFSVSNNVTYVIFTGYICTLMPIIKGMQGCYNTRLIHISYPNSTSISKHCSIIRSLSTGRLQVYLQVKTLHFHIQALPRNYVAKCFRFQWYYLQLMKLLKLALKPLHQLQVIHLKPKSLAYIIWAVPVYENANLTLADIPVPTCNY